MSVNAAIADAAGNLAATSATPRLDAELLMAHALGISREALLLGGRDGPVPSAFAALVARRRLHEPVAYIVGRRAFWTIELAVAPGVLIPRPDSETLIEAAIAHFGDGAPARVLDLGTGSGALLLAALSHWPDASGCGVDTSPVALGIARANAARLGLSHRVAFAGESWEAARQGGFDLILCNPPYIAAGEPLPPDVLLHEPASALFAGADGLDDYRAIAPLLRISRGGCACIEIGAGQAAVVGSLFRAQGWLTQIKCDLAGRARCIVVTAAG